VPNFVVPTAGSNRPSTHRRLFALGTFMIATALPASLLLPGSVSATAAPTKARPTLTLSASPKTIEPNRTSKLTAVLTVRNKPVAKAAIRFEQRYHGGHVWRAIATAKSGASGKASAPTPAHIKNVDYRAVYAGSAKLARKTSTVKTVAVKQSVSVTKRSAKTVTAGNLITIRGKTSPALAKHVAYLQIRSGKTWTSVTHAAVSKTRTFTVRAKATQAGKKDYRIMVRGGTGIASAASAAIRFNVYGWFYLADLDTVNSSRNWSSMGTVTMGAKNQTHSVGSLWSYGSFGGWTGGSAEYNLSYRCTTLRATIGIPDTSGTKASWGFQVTVDDTTGPDTYVGLGQPKQLQVDLRNGFRLTLTNDRIDGDPWQDYQADAVWGHAQLLCLGRP